MDRELMNTKEVAQYLHIHEKQVYALVKTGRIPATRVTGKWLFPKRLVDNWIEENSRRAPRETKTNRGAGPGMILAAGSNDPALDILINVLRSSQPDMLIFTANTGSAAGLKALGEGRVDLAWIHLFDPVVGRYNTPAVISPYLPEADWVLVHLFTREIGLLVQKGNPA
ncbi:MAG: helix-turn-helix domain-containing protein, partial [Syntrophales bacterium]|nr:helix-turn-helix domain-containing protein [Syntrophales bacterium]